MAATKKSDKTTIYVPTTKERLVFMQAMMPVHQKMASRVGKEMIQEVDEEIGSKSNSL